MPRVSFLTNAVRDILALVMDINHRQLLRQWPVGRDPHHHQRVRTGIIRVQRQVSSSYHRMENQQKRLDFIGQIVGKYCLVGQVNYEEYLKAIGLTMAKRAIAINQVPCVDLKIHDDEWSVLITGIIKDSEFQFYLGVEMQRVTLDGRQVTDLFTLVDEGDELKILQKETWGNFLEAVIVHEFDGDDWDMTITFGDVTCVRHFRRE